MEHADGKLSRQYSRSAAVARHRIAILAFFAVVPLSDSSLLAQAWPPAGGEGPCQITKETNVPARMRDGVVLYA